MIIQSLDVSTKSDVSVISLINKSQDGNISTILSMHQSRDIYDYKLILESFVGDFGYVYYHTILTWCGVLDDADTDKYWQLWIVKSGQHTVGICGLYSMHPNSTKQLWLGWLAVIPRMRNLKIGESILHFLKAYAESAGCEELMSYVDHKSQAALRFYCRNGFIRIGDVEDYLNNNADIEADNFESLSDHIIKYEITKCKT